MKGAWPKVAARWGRWVTVSHSLESMGNPDDHEHDMQVTIGWEHEINPRHGHSGFPLAKTEKMLDKLLALCEEKSLNEIMPDSIPPTAENLAVWLLVRCPGFIDYVEVLAYGNYEVRASRAGLRSEMVAAYLGGDRVLELTV